MKSLSAYNATAIDNPHADIIRLLKIEFSGLTLCMSDRTWGTGADFCTFNSNIYEPLVLSFGSIQTGEINPVSYEVDISETEIVLDNNTPVGGANRFTSLFTSYAPHYAAITVSEIFNGASAAGDEIVIFKGAVEDFRSMTTDQVTVVCSGYDLYIQNKFAIETVDPAVYGSADPDDIGKMLPQVYGQAKRVPFMAVDAGGITTIAEGLDASETTIIVSDIDRLDDAGTVQIDAEQIGYTGKSGDDLTGCTRGDFGTDKVEHELGAKIAQVKSSYIYIIGHAVNAIDAVYVDEVQQPAANYTVYTGQTGDQHPQYGAKAVVEFNTLPILSKQINVEINDTIDVADTTGIDDPGHEHSTTGLIRAFDFDTSAIATGSHWANISGCLQRATNNQAQNDGQFNESLSLTFGVTQSLSGTPTRIRICTYNGIDTDDPLEGYTVAIGPVPSPYICIASVPDESYIGQYQSQNFKSDWYDVTDTLAGYELDTWEKLMARPCRVKTSPGSMTAKIWHVWLEVEYTETPGSAYAGVSITGGTTKTGTVELTGNSVADTVIGERVAADVDGWQDDGAGTYTGTPDALIERPDHICKHILIGQCGLTASEIDSTSYTAAGAAYAARSFKLALAILQRPNARSLLQRIAYQARSVQLWESGAHRIEFVPDAAAVDLAIDATRIDMNQVYVQYTPRIDIKNTIIARCDRFWDGTEDDETFDRAAVGFVEPNSVTKYGTLEGDSISLAYVPATSQARFVLEWIGADLANPRLVVEFVGGYYLTQLERGDIIRFDEMQIGPADAARNELNYALLELVSLGVDKFRVIGMERRSDLSIQIKAVQIEDKIFAYDTIGISESITTVMDGLTLEAHQDIEITEAPGVIPDIGVSAGEDITINENTPIGGDWMEINAAETINITEAPAMGAEWLEIRDANESITISDNFVSDVEDVCADTNDNWTIQTRGDWDVEPCWFAVAQKWTSGEVAFTYPAFLSIDDAGSWTTSFRPTKMRLTHNAADAGDTVDVLLYDSDNDVIASDTGYTSGDEITITFSGQDINRLVVQGALFDDFEFDVTEIEFYDGSWTSYL